MKENKEDNQNPASNVKSTKTSAVDQFNLGAVMKSLTSVLGSIQPTGAAVKMQRKKVARGRGPAADPGKTLSDLTCTMLKDLSKAHVKVWRYMSLTKKCVTERQCQGENVQLYNQVSKSYPNQPLITWWTTFENDTVIVCYNNPAFCSDLPKKQMYINKFAANWFPEAAKFKLEFHGEVIVVPMNHTRYDEFKIAVKRRISARSASISASTTTPKVGSS